MVNALSQAAQACPGLLQTELAPEAGLCPRAAQQAPIPIAQLRDYIAFSRAHCHPALSPEAAADIIDGYMNMRSVGSSRKVPPVLVLPGCPQEQLTCPCNAHGLLVGGGVRFPPSLLYSVRAALVGSGKTGGTPAHPGTDQMY